MDFLNARLDPGASMAKPMENEESFCATLDWIVSSGRGNRLESFLISVPDWQWEGARAHAYALYWRCGARCWRLWSTILTLLVECNRGRVLLQPETVVWATRLFSPHCYDLEFTVPVG